MNGRRLVYIAEVVYIHSPLNFGDTFQLRNDQSGTLFVVDCILALYM